MPGGLMQLLAYGAQDVYLTGDNEITHYEVNHIYKSGSNISVENILDEMDMVSLSVSNTCAICIDDVSEAPGLECGHLFHKDCLAEWFKKSRTCPVCRHKY